jgi:hypothetical protein
MMGADTMTQLPPHPNIVRLHAHWMSDDRKDMWLLLEHGPVLPALHICNVVRRYCSEGNLAQFLLYSDRLNDAALWDLTGQLLRAVRVRAAPHRAQRPQAREHLHHVPKIGDLGPL